MHSISCSQSKFPHSRQKANGSRRSPLLYQPGTTPDTKLLKQQRILPGNSMPALRDRYFARYQSGAIGLYALCNACALGVVMRAGDRTRGDQTKYVPSH
jgi:hypothetical protein